MQNSEPRGRLSGFVRSFPQPPPVAVGLALTSLAILFVYAGMIDAPLLPWDDDYNLWKNPFIAVGGWWKLWGQSFYGMYVPVTDSAWAFLYWIGGGQPWPFRAANVIFHMANACLVFALIDAWLKKTRSASWPAALFGAALFALHPLQVGSVAWASDLRGILSAFFGLWATLAFFRWPGWRGSLTGCALFVLALLSKPQIAALPIALVAASYALNKENLFKVAARLWPWVAASACAAFITRAAQEIVIEWKTPLWMRPIAMADSYGFYLLKTLFPFNLAVDYGRTPTYLQDDLARAFPTVAAFAIALGALVWFAKRDRKWSIGAAWFAFLSPTSGIVDFGFQQISTVADHYCYVPLVVVAMLTATVAAPLFKAGARSWAAAVGATSLALGLSVASAFRTDAWIGERPFFADMVAKNPNSYSALIGLTNMLCMSADQQDKEQGLVYARRATQIRTEDPVSVADYAVCLIRLGRFSEALDLESHLKNPDFVRRMKRHDFATSSFLMSIGGTAYYLGKIDRAFVYLCEGAAANSMNQQARAQIELLQKELAARGDRRECGPRLGLDASIARANQISDGRAGPSPASVQ